MENGPSGKMASLNLREAMWKTRLTAFGKNGLIRTNVSEGKYIMDSREGLWKHWHRNGQLFKSAI